jgi:predicted transposase/invertase (TIGR01784 family)
MEKGMEQGRAEEKISTSRKMKLKGYPLEDIAEMTGLTLSEINDL